METLHTNLLRRRCTYRSSESDKKQNWPERIEGEIVAVYQHERSLRIVVAVDPSDAALRESKILETNIGSVRLLPKLGR